jgi:ribosomal protein L24E
VCNVPVGACEPGTSLPCETDEGTGVRGCMSDCSYADSCEITARVCTEPEAAPCGQYDCGRTGDCNPATGRRACVEDEDPCEPGTTTPCMTAEGTGVRTCSQDCEYAAQCQITSRVCTEPVNAPCGEYNCGRTGDCNPATGRRACIEDESPCEPGSTVACSTGEGTGIRRCGNDCSLAQECEITARACTGDAGVPCGRYSCGRTGDCNPATGERICNEAADPCEPGTPASCTTEAGGPGTRTCGPDCRFPAECRATALMCAEEENAPCGMWGCGRTGECNTATGVRACAMPASPCEPGTGVPCQTSEGSGARLCQSDCRYTEQCLITVRNCTQPENEPCGAYACGRTGQCDTGTGQRVCNELPEPCEPRTFENCAISYDGGTLAGVRACTDSCEWGRCEEVIIE